MFTIVLTDKFGYSFNVVNSLFVMRVEVSYQCLSFNSFSAHVCGPTILEILNFPVAFYFRAHTLQLQSAFLHTTV